ncbi:MAG: PAS domain S-box protein [Verrucomicrobiae bacterium]|nr:PAS domain S-box protein [Verrucomicrobiae bacterium]
MQATSFQDILIQIINTVADPIFVMDRQHRVLLANDACCQFNQRRREEVVGKNVRDLFPRDEADIMRANDEKVFLTGQENVNEEKVTDARGTVHTVIVKKNLCRGDAGELLVVGVLRDITEQKRTEAALQESEMQYHSLVQDLPCGVFRKDAAGRYIFANDHFLQRNGLTADEILGKTPHEYLATRLDVRTSESMRQQRTHLGIQGHDNHQEIMGTGKTIILDEVLTFPDGTTKYFQAVKSPVRDAAGRIIGTQGVQFDITERKQAEQAVARARDFLNKIINAVADPIFVKDRRHRYVLLNEAACQFSGHKAADMIGKTTHDLFPPELAKIICAHDEKFFEGRQDGTSELTLADGLGAIHHTITNMSRFQDEHGQELMVGVVRDITQREQAKTALRQSEDRYRALFNHTQSAVLLNASPDSEGRPGKFIEVNDVACRRLGYTREEMLQLTPLAIIAPEILPKMPPILAKLKSAGHVVWEGLDVAKDGRRIPVEIHSHMIELNGQPVVMSETRDLTDWKQSEEQLRKLSRAMEQSPVSIVITNPKGNIEYVNPKFINVTGYTLAEVAGKNPRFLKSSNPTVDQVKQYKQLWATILSGNEWHGEFQNRKKNGELFWESASISPITDPDGKITHFLAVKEDITSQKLLEAEFRQAQKMEAFGRLAAGVAHDFNNMLTAILCSTQIFEIGNPLDEYQLGALAEITEAANRAASLTRQLLMFSRRQAIQLKVLEVNDVTDGMSKMLRRLIGENISLKTRYGTGGTPVFADPNMLEQVLLNLSVNSRDAMPKGGELTICTEAVTITEATGRRKPGRFIRLSVSDTGSGISAQNLEHIFEPFFTTKEVGKGTGLGLATVFGIVEQHKGWIEVESEIGRGTTFHIFLPRHEATAETGFIQRSKPRERGGKEVILLVEDELSVRTLARNILTRHGYQVYEAGSGQAALDVWQQHGPQIDLLFTDMVMPGQMTGLELGQQLLKDKPGLKLVYTSGYTDEMLDEGSELLKSSYFLNKPYSPELLLRMLRTALD